MKEKTRAEGKRGFPSVWNFVKLAYKIYPAYFPLAFFSAVFDAVFPFLGILMPGFILNELSGARRMEYLMWYAGILIGGNGIAGLISSILRKKLLTAGERLADGFELHVGRHIMHMEFGMLEDAGILDLKEKALFNIRLHDALLGGPKTLVEIFRLVMVLGGVAGMTIVFNPLLTAILLLLVGINVLIYRRTQATKFRFYQDIAVYNRQFAYFRNLTQDFKNAKDVRLFHMSEYIIKRMGRYRDAVNRIFHKMFLTQRRHDGLSAAIIQTQTLAAYLFAVLGVFRKTIGIGDFAMYLSAANQFSHGATQLMAKMVDLQMLDTVFRDYFAFEQLPCSSPKGNRSSVGTSSVQVVFQDVWFRYPNTREYALKGVSITIKKGERLAIVGRNGAGKTTFIKLLCRLYQPDKGCILLNGVNINEFEEREYNRLLSVLFQDYKIFSFTVEENLAFQEAIDRERLKAALEKAGLWDKIEKLPLGSRTSLYKNFDKDGVELSGGEMQKLAIARLLYKNAPLVILDEPTAALDPYAEYEVYSKLNAMTEDKTTIYISHRLSSCCFCDTVAVFDQGELVEHGSHGELVETGKLYARMWESQARYYQ